MDPTFATASTEPRRIIGLAAGFWFIYLCDYWTGIQTGSVPDLWSWTNAYGFKVIALVVAGVLLYVAHPGRTAAHVTDILSVAIIEAGVLTLAISHDNHLQPPVPLIASALVQLGVVWLIVRWGLCSKAVGLRQTFFALVVGALAVSLSKILLALLPSVASTALIMVAAPISVLGMRPSKHAIPVTYVTNSQQAFFANPELDLRKALLRMFAVALVFFSVWSYLNVMSKVEFGHYGYGPTSRPGMVVISQAMAIVLFAVAFLWSFVLRRDVDLEGLWRLAILWLGVAVGASATGALSLLSQAFVSSAFEFGFSLLYLSVAAYCRQTTAHPGAVFALGSLALVAPQWGARAIVGAWGTAPLSAVATSAAFIALLAAVVLLLPGRSPDTQLVAQGLNEGEATPTPPDASSKVRASQLVSTYNLTDREMEVVQLLASGRTKRYVAETMCLSENTIRTYARRAYQKLGVHSRGELQDLLWGKNRQNP